MLGVGGQWAVRGEMDWGWGWEDEEWEKEGEEIQEGREFVSGFPSLFLPFLTRNFWQVPS